MDVTEKWLLEVQERNVEVGRGEMRTHPGGVSGYNPTFLCGVFLLLKKKIRFVMEENIPAKKI